ncbi:MAG: 3-dehydroquinate synthase [Bacteroidia bacterium]|nr:MAG: 3-dehydroquinate synthase [Bacteroidia bacterium]
MQRMKLNTPAGSTEIVVGEHLWSDLKSLGQEAVLLVDEHVLCQHHDIFETFRTITVPSGEQYKTLQTVESIYRELVKLEADRSTMLVGVGGGLATDVAGFVASTYLRGVPFGFISTTLLGQVDASIGGKNGVNLDGYKNMVGNFRQPSFVWCDLSLLSTLANREYVSGIAEVIKYGAIWDVQFMEYLEKHMELLLTQEIEVLEHVVSVSAAIKVDVVEKDEKESDLRRILNFGHTMGHAIERHQKVLHGEAVGMGMIMAAQLSNNLGLLPSAEVDRLQQIVSSAGLPVEMRLDPDELFLNIRKDKKKSGEFVHFVLLDGPGSTVIKPIALTELKSMIHDLC